MYFDGIFLEKGMDLRLFWFHLKIKWLRSFKLYFEVANNVEEYEALILGLELTKKMKVHRLSVFGDSELVPRKVRNICQTKQHRLKAYKNETWDYIKKYFQAFNIEVVPREDNMQDESLEIFASTLKYLNLFNYNIRLRLGIDLQSHII